MPEQEIFLYLTTTGRKSGNSHRIEIWFVAHGDCYYLCAEHGEKSDWVQNIMQNDTVSFYIAQREQDVPSCNGRASIVTDGAALTILRDKFDKKYKWSDGLFVQVCDT